MLATQRNSAIAARDLTYHLHPQTELSHHEECGPHIFEQGDRIYVVDTDGNRYIEGLAGLWCTSLGFSERRLAAAANLQLTTLPFYHNFAHKTVPCVANLAEKLIEIAPDPVSRVFFTNSGSEANDTMVKMVWYFNNVRGQAKKKKIISRYGAYHGITVAASSLTGMPYAHTYFDAPLDRFLHADCPHYYHFGTDGESEEEYATQLTANLEKLILQEGPETIAAFIAEPVMGAGGVILPPKTYFEKVQALLRRHKILFVADEVICGFGRTGNMFGCDTYDIRPDIVIVAKALSSGYIPIGGVLITDEIYQVLVEGSKHVGTFGTGFTYSGHPVSCAVALETLRIYEECDIVSRVRELEPIFQRRLSSFADHPKVGEVRGIGLIGAIEFVQDKKTRTNFDPKLKVGAKIADLALSEGLIIRALRNDTIAFCPPMIIEPDEIDDMFDRFQSALDKASDILGVVRGDEVGK